MLSAQLHKTPKSADEFEMHSGCCGFFHSVDGEIMMIKFSDYYPFKADLA
jgi:hypothetical protein